MSQWQWHDYAGMYESEFHHSVPQPRFVFVFVCFTQVCEDSGESLGNMSSMPSTNLPECELYADWMNVSALRADLEERLMAMLTRIEDVDTCVERNLGQGWAILV